MANTIQDNLAKVLDGVNAGQCIKGIAEQLANAGRVLRSVHAHFDDAMRVAAESLKHIPAAIQRYNQEMTFLLPWLAEQSWYVGVEMPLATLGRVAVLARAEDVAAVDSIMCAWYRVHARQVVEAVIERFPDRRTVLAPALEAHLLGNFSLAIPAFLAQADGVGLHYMEAQFFCTTRWKRQYDEFIRTTTLSELSSLMLLPLGETGKIRTDTRKLVPQSGGLNRHAILHGHDSNYGTETNSLKCVSLLDYLYSVGETIIELEREQQSTVGKM